MPRAKSTVCRYCQRPGRLFHGAHKVCKNAFDRARLRTERGSDPKLFWGRDDKCADCPAPRAGKSPRCLECQKKKKIADKKQWWKEGHPLQAERKCQCGCGVVFRANRRYYATPECREKNRERAKEQRKRRDPSTYSTPSIVVKQTLCARVMTRKQEEPIGEFVNPGIAVTKVPPVLRPSLRNMFGDERGETWLATDW